MRERFAVFDEHLQLEFGLFVASGFSRFLAFLDTRLYGLEILELELGVDDLFVAYGIDRAVHMHDVLVVETTEHMNDCVRLTDIGEELVSESFAFAGTFDQPRNIHDFNGSRNNSSLGFAQFAEFDEAFVGNGNDAHIRFDRAEGEIGALRFCVA